MAELARGRRVRRGTCDWPHPIRRVPNPMRPVCSEARAIYLVCLGVGRGAMPTKLSDHSPRVTMYNGSSTGGGGKRAILGGPNGHRQSRHRYHVCRSGRSLLRPAQTTDRNVIGSPLLRQDGHVGGRRRRRLIASADAGPRETLGSSTLVSGGHGGRTPAMRRAG